MELPWELYLAPVGGGVARCAFPPFWFFLRNIGGMYLPPCSPGLSTAENLSSSSPFSASKRTWVVGDFSISAAILEALASRSLYSGVLSL